MKRTKLVVLIDRLEGYSTRHPAAYRLRVVMLAALGYGYLFGVVFALLLSIYLILAYAAFNFVTIKVAWIVLVIVGVVLRSMWVTVPEPDGRELDRDKAPGLFDLINDVRLALHGPRVHHVFISNEFNAGIVQVPQLGMFGWVRNYLVIGLPLLSALTPEEFRAVLAHEFGHLSGNHGRFSAWIYRLRKTWIQILTTVRRERHYASFLFEPFLKWYAPFFNAYSFVLARAQEYEADRYSVELAGRNVAAKALVRLDTKTRALSEDFWPSFFRGASEESQPPKDPFVRMLGGMGLALDRGHAEKWFLQRLQTKTDYDDTHPSLADRLVGMGYDRETISSPEVVAELVQTTATADRSAAESYLLELPEGMVSSFDRLLRERIVPSWRERHKSIGEARKRLGELAEKSSKEPLTEEELWERVRLLNESSDAAASLPTLKEIIAFNPSHVSANFALGALLLEADDESGVQFLEKAIELEQSITGDACELLYYFYRRHGREEEANSCRTRGEEFNAKLRVHYETALKISANDTFAPHDLNAEELVKLQTELRQTRRLKKAFLVKKILKDDEQPLFVLGVISNYAWHDFHSREDSNAILNKLVNDVQLTQRQVLFLMLEREDKHLRKVFSAIPGAQVFPPQR
jgi:Zn-dependent protease with chaperone function